MFAMGEALASVKLNTHSERGGGVEMARVRRFGVYNGNEGDSMRDVEDEVDVDDEGSRWVNAKA